jgi:hypothetical protein
MIDGKAFDPTKAYKDSKVCIVDMQKQVVCFLRFAFDHARDADIFTGVQRFDNERDAQAIRSSRSHLLCYFPGVFQDPKQWKLGTLRPHMKSLEGI